MAPATSTSHTSYAAQHKAPNGPGDGRPTALQIIEDEQLTNQWTDKVVMITGGASGIGVETARALYATGAHVFLPARNLTAAEDVKQDIVQSQPNSKGQIDVLELHLDSLQSVRQCAAAFLEQSHKLNILITNSGIMACPEAKTQDGFESQFGTNHLGHFLLFQLLKPTLLKSSTPQFNSRVICVSSSAHKNGPLNFSDLDWQQRGYSKWGAYGQSKISNVYMSNEIERRYGAQGLHSNSVMPGGIMTPLQKHLSADEMKGDGSEALKNAIKSTAQGAATQVWAATAQKWEGQGGLYLEDCQVAEPFDKSKHIIINGHAPYAYDEDAATKLWTISNQLVGFAEE